MTRISCIRAGLSYGYAISEMINISPQPSPDNIVVNDGVSSGVGSGRSDHNNAHNVPAEELSRVLPRGIDAAGVTELILRDRWESHKAADSTAIDSLQGGGGYVTRIGALNANDIVAAHFLLTSSKYVMSADIVFSNQYIHIFQT